MESHFNTVIAVGNPEVATNAPCIAVKRTDTETHGTRFDFVSKHGGRIDVPLLTTSNNLQTSPRHYVMCRKIFLLLKMRWKGAASGISYRRVMSPDVRYTMNSASRLWIVLIIDSILLSTTIRMTVEKKRTIQFVKDSRQSLHQQNKGVMGRGAIGERPLSG